MIQEKRLKKGLNILLTLCMVLLGMLFFFPATAQAAGTGVKDKLNELRSKYPDGKYWNHYVSQIEESADYYYAYDPWNETFAENVTSTPCAHHNDGYYGSYVGLYDCSFFDGGQQCFGFARKVFYDVFGVKCSSLPQNRDPARVQVGDYVRFEGTFYDQYGNPYTAGHSFIVIERSGNEITVVECNWGLHLDNHCQIRWGRSFNITDTISGMRFNHSYHAPNYDEINNSDKAAPVISNVRVTDVDSTGYTVLCDVTDNEGVARVSFPTWTHENGQDDLAQDWYDSCAVFQPSYGNTYMFRVNSAAHNNEYGAYATHIYAYDAAGNVVFAEFNVTLPPSPTPTPVPTPKPTPISGGTLSGTVKCFGKGSITTLQLVNSSGVVMTSMELTDNVTEYTIENVPTGNYILRVSKAGHVTREYHILMTDKKVSQDIEIWFLGDVNGDGTVNARDKKLLYNHIEKISVLSGYLFDIGDVNGDGTINARDKKILYNHIERVAPLW